jgi:sulfonate transport system substrate-binding protein
MRSVPTYSVHSVLLASLALASCALAGAKEIRLAIVGNPFDKPLATGIIGYAQEHKLFEKEFEKDGIAIKWDFYKGTGPAINEGLANGGVDITSYGDLPGILGKAGGIDTRLIVPGSVGQNIYVALPPKSPIKSLQELKGKRIGYLKGTYLHLSWVRLVRGLGLSEKDFKVFNLSQTEGVAALQGDHIDAYVGVNTFLELADRGGARILYASNTRDARAREIQGFSVVVGSAKFVTEHPDLVQRWVNVYVRASVAVLDETRREDWIKLAIKPGYAESEIRKDLADNPLAEQNAPVFDDRYFGKLRTGIQASLESGLIRREIDIPKWVDRSFLDKALRTEAAGIPWAKGFPATIAANPQNTALAGAAKP